MALSVSSCLAHTRPLRVKRVVVVTGADRGIGFEVSRELGEMGYRVVLTSPDRAKGERAADKICREGSAVSYQKLDLLDERDIRETRDYVMGTFGRIDVLVNNAGVMLDSGKSRVEGLLGRMIKRVPRRAAYGVGPGILTVPMDIFRATLEVNTLGALKMCQAFVPLMMKARYGRVVNVSSTLGQLYDMDDEDKVPAYQMSKTALNAVTRLVADAAKGRNVAVNSVCPGWTRTDIGGRDAPQSTAQAAETIVWLAAQPDNGPTGGFFRHKRRIVW